MYRVIQWTTGNVGRRAVRAIVEHPELELVGLYAHGKDKVGRDAGELCGLPHLGVRATRDVDELLALRADCLSYSTLVPKVEEIERFLESGVNVVGTAGYILGTYLEEGARERLDAAGKRGNASLYGSGFNPGLSNVLALVGTGMCDRIYSVSVTESVDVTDYASPATWEAMGWGQPLGSPSTSMT